MTERARRTSCEFFLYFGIVEKMWYKVFAITRKVVTLHICAVTFDSLLQSNDFWFGALVCYDHSYILVATICNVNESIDCVEWFMFRENNTCDVLIERWKKEPYAQSAFIRAKMNWLQFFSNDNCMITPCYITQFQEIISPNNKVQIL